MGTIHADIRLRPTRFAFMVKPDELETLRTIFEVNTCLWGGKFNPVIPVFKRRPQWWDRKPHRFETPQAIVNGYLDYFEPDILVVTSGLQDSTFGFDKDRVISLEQLVADSEWDSSDLVSHGTSVLSLYRDLYKREFQFAKRDPDNFLYVESQGSSHAAMCAAIFGAFPKKGRLAQLRADFDDVFTPQQVRLGSNTVAALFERVGRTPLHLTQEGLEIDFDHAKDPKLFVLDSTKPADLIDYWNLRAGVSPIVPIPLQYVSELSPFVRSFIESNYRPLPRNRNGVMIRPSVMFGRSIPEEECNALFAEHFRVETPGANSMQTWYPAIWTNQSELMVAPTRPRVTAAENSHYIPLEAETFNIQFDALEPSFAEKFGGEARWVNVVKLGDGSYSDGLATVYPENYRDPRLPDFGNGIGQILPTREGYVAFCRYSGMPHFWQLESATAAIRRWLEGRQIKARISGSGRATQQIVQTLGGLGRIGAIANREIVKLFDGLSRKPINKTMQHDNFRNCVQNAGKGSVWNRNAFQILVDKNAVEIGLEVCCTKCGNWSWYALQFLANELACQLCLKAYAFPATDPGGGKSTRWAYRVVGPFAQPNYAQGGYAAALSMRFFSNVLGPQRGKVAWAAGQELTMPDGSKAEADFILWYRREKMFGARFQTQTIFGEAKSFGRDTFTTDDVARMKALAEEFPGSVLVFSTMRAPGELSQEEVYRLASLAQWGRHRERGRDQSRAPVIVLTGTELFAEYSLSHEWKALGGRHAELISPAYVRIENLHILADLTQQLYLGLEPYHSYQTKRWERQKQRSRANDSSSSSDAGQS